MEASAFITIGKTLRDEYNKWKKSKDKEKEKNLLKIENFIKQVRDAVLRTAKFIDEHPNKEPSRELQLLWKQLFNKTERLYNTGVLKNDGLCQELQLRFDTKSNYWKHPEKWTTDFKEAGITLEQIDEIISEFE